MLSTGLQDFGNTRLKRSVLVIIHRLRDCRTTGVLVLHTHLIFIIHRLQTSLLFVDCRNMTTAGPRQQLICTAKSLSILKLREFSVEFFFNTRESKIVTSGSN